MEQVPSLVNNHSNPNVFFCLLYNTNAANHLFWYIYCDQFLIMILAMIYWVYEAYLKHIIYLNLIQPKVGMNFNRSPSKNPAIKTPLVVSFSLRVSVHFSPLAAFSCQGSSKDSHYIFRVLLLFQC